MKNIITYIINPWDSQVFLIKGRVLCKLKNPPAQRTKGKEPEHVLSNKVGVIFECTPWVESRRQDH